MKFEQLKNSLKEEISPIYLLEGEEAFFRERGEGLIKSAVLEEPELNYARYEGSTLKQSGFEGLVSALACCPFMSQKRVITVTEWYPTVQELKDKTLKAYFEAPFDTSVLVIINSKKSESLKKIAAVTFVDCAKATGELVSKYIRSKTNKAQLIISTRVCQLLQEYCQNDMTRIDVEIDKLIAFKEGEDEITEKDVELMVSKTMDYQVYQMVQFIADKNYNAAYKVIQDLTTISEKQLLFVSVYYHFRRMFFASISSQSDRELAQILGVKEFAILKARQQAASFSPKRLRKILNKLGQLDGDYKSGKMLFDNAFLSAMFSVLIES
ncbi:MAG: DNA polymerase III subunit delta [Clostridia bacterium]|nr:DNA polymerase III subunit delta [Clostridia bacterium]